MWWFARFSMIFFMYTCIVPFWLSLLAGKAALVWRAQLSVSNKNVVRDIRYSTTKIWYASSSKWHSQCLIVNQQMIPNSLLVLGCVWNLATLALKSYTVIWIPRPILSIVFYSDILLLLILLFLSMSTHYQHFGGLWDLEALMVDTIPWAWKSDIKLILNLF